MSSGTKLTNSERRIAEVILEAPQQVGFGTVAELAKAAGVGAASVVRLALKLGFEGYTALQASVQRDLMYQLRPAADRIADAISQDNLPSHTAVELANISTTLDQANNDALVELTSRLADLERPVVVLSGEASAGVAIQFEYQLQQLRSGVRRIDGNDVVVKRDIALLDAQATAVVIDLKRYETWVLDAHAMLADRGVWSVALTDSVLSPVASRAQATFVVAAGSLSPFDSHVGTLALLNMIVSRVAELLRPSAANRLAKVEAVWASSGALTDAR